MQPRSSVERLVLNLIVNRLPAFVVRACMAVEDVPLSTALVAARKPPPAWPWVINSVYRESSRQPYSHLGAEDTSRKRAPWTHTLWARI